MRFNKRIPVIAILVFLLMVPSVANVRSRLQTKNSRWTVVEFPTDQQVKLGFKVVNFNIVRAFPKRSEPASRADEEEPDVDSSRADVPIAAAWAIVTRSGTSTKVDFSVGLFPGNATYYLYVIDGAGLVINNWKLTTTASGNTRWRNLNTDAGTFMLALSVSDTLANIETSKSVFMISDVPEGFRITPKNP